jgi:hypothetical protein
LSAAFRTVSTRLAVARRVNRAGFAGGWLV